MSVSLCVCAKLSCKCHVVIALQMYDKTSGDGAEVTGSSDQDLLRSLHVGFMICTGFDTFCPLTLDSDKDKLHKKALLWGKKMG